MAETLRFPSSRAAAPPDAEARREALDIHRSFIVEAPAGSGKTGLLIQRLLKLLADPSVEQPEQVLAITFTNKATAEMRDRVLAHLAAAAQSPESSQSSAGAAILVQLPPPHREPPPTEDDFQSETLALAQAVLARDRQLGWELLDHPHRLNIRTIDSVCAEIARTLPVLSGSGGRLTPADDAGPSTTRPPAAPCCFSAPATPPSTRPCATSAAPRRQPRRLRITAGRHAPPARPVGRPGPPHSHRSSTRHGSTPTSCPVSNSPSTTPSRPPSLRSRKPSPPASSRSLQPSPQTSLTPRPTIPKSRLPSLSAPASTPPEPLAAAPRPLARANPSPHDRQQENYVKKEALPGNLKFDYDRKSPQPLPPCRDSPSTQRPRRPAPTLAKRPNSSPRPIPRQTSGPSPNPSSAYSAAL